MTSQSPNPLHSNDADGARVRMDRSVLRGFERLAVPLLEQWNQREGLKRGVQSTLNEVNARWILYVMRNRLKVWHEAPVLNIEAPQGMILVANHLSFFDMYITASWMQRHTDLVKHVYFPVRSTYFYERPDGLLVNMLISGGSMWPPVFRDSERRGLNEAGMRQLSQVLGPGAVVGFHPEGTRNKGTDRYTLVGSRPGVGRLIQQCHPDVVVLPYFIIGMTNDFVGEVKPGLVNGPPVEDVRILFGTPKRAGELAPLGTAQVITDQLMAEVQALGLQDRARYGADSSTP